ncbi:MAG TPA: TM2 domain-containing protein [Pyrinomonadaceae bacterium]|jgi:TM2 domain-containing membrane protein YozV|nr:TM2 domain-containing protein [Pyrinomonadaceae bacterium]
MTVFCTRCGTQNQEFAQNCAQCGAALPVIGARTAEKQPDYAPPYDPSYQPIQPPSSMYAQPRAEDWQKAGADKKLVAGLCGILLGGFGVHKFILGYTNEGIIQLVLGLCFGIGGIIGIIEGIIYLTKSDEDFVRTYIYGHKGWF